MMPLQMNPEPAPTRPAETAILPLRNFDTVFRDHGDKVFSTAAAMAGNVQDAEEITQEVFLKIHKYLPRFKGRSSINTWIYRITMNTVSDYLGKRSRMQAMHTDVCLDDLECLGRLWNARDDVEQVYKNRQLGGALRAALMCLPPHYRAVFVLKEIDGYAYCDIAEILDIPLGTVESRLYRARNLLRKSLTNETIGE